MAATIVVKIGSSSITRASGPDPVLLASAIDAAISARASDHNVVLVSSGAVASGTAFLSRTTTGVLSHRVAAAVGQPLLMDTYRFLGSMSGSLVCQILVSEADLRSASQMRLVSEVIAECLEAGIVPVINGNDVSDPVGSDNDSIAAAIAVMTGAQRMLLLTDMAGVLSDPAVDTSTIPEIAAKDLHRVKVSNVGSGRGGLRGKLRAAELASHNGIETHIAAAKSPNAIAVCVDGGAPGTRIRASGVPQPQEDRWIAGVAASHGRLTINRAAEINIRKGSSLFASGIKRVVGNFRAGQIVEIVSPAGALIARGECRASSSLLTLVRALQAEEVASVMTEIVEAQAGSSQTRSDAGADSSKKPERPQAATAVQAVRRSSVDNRRALALEILNLFPNVAIDAMSAKEGPSLRERLLLTSSNLSFVERSKLVVFSGVD